MKKILVITYYWPPSGSSGVQRTLYFVKYLRDSGWEPLVYVPKNPEYPEIDTGLSKDIPSDIKVYSQPIWEPYRFYKKLIGKKQTERIKPQVVLEENQSFLQKISIFIRGNLFIPDARKYWIKPSVKYLTQILRTQKIDAIFSTSPPQSIHLIAQQLSQRYHIPWLADFRDPWTRISYFNHLHLTMWARKYHAKLEQAVLQNATRVTTVSPACANDFQTIGKREVHVVTNGFDGEIAEPKKEFTKFQLTYIGTLTNSRVPKDFWKVLADSVHRDTEISKHFSLLLFGNIEESVFSAIEKAGIKYERSSYLPHEQVLDCLRNSFALLLFGIQQEPGVLTGKVFEYMQAVRPILCVSPKGSDLEKMLLETNTGFNADYDEPETTRKNVQKLMDICRGKLEWQPNLTKIAAYSRKKTTEQLAKLLDSML